MMVKYHCLKYTYPQDRIELYLKIDGFESKYLKQSVEREEILDLFYFGCRIRMSDGKENYFFKMEPMHMLIRKREAQIAKKKSLNKILCEKFSLTG